MSRDEWLFCTDPCCSIKGRHHLSDKCDQMQDAFCAECGDELPPGHDPYDLCPICSIVSNALAEPDHEASTQKPKTGTQ
ncbi:MAG: hypothetical protein KDI55_00115 [Anaerolineae bacterium]|nr:hypothetical protein [Anaerolineae bacterium]